MSKTLRTISPGDPFVELSMSGWARKLTTSFTKKPLERRQQPSDSRLHVDTRNCQIVDRPTCSQRGVAGADHLASSDGAKIRSP